MITNIYIIRTRSLGSTSYKSIDIILIKQLMRRLLNQIWISRRCLNLTWLSTNREIHDMTHGFLKCNFALLSFLDSLQLTLSIFPCGCVDFKFHFAHAPCWNIYRPSWQVDELCGSFWRFPDVMVQYKVNHIPIDGKIWCRNMSE